MIFTILCIIGIIFLSSLKTKAPSWNDAIDASESKEFNDDVY